MTGLTGAQILKDWETALDRRGTIIEVGRQTGTSPNAMFWASCRARVKGYRPDALVGNVIQGEVSIRAFYPDLIENRFPLPVRNTDKVRIPGGQPAQINAVDMNTGRDGNTQVFVKIMAVG
jgi:hypothetical protein